MKRLSLPPALLLLALIINTGISTMAQTQTTDPATPSARPNDTATAPSVPAPPVAKKIPRTSTVHDTTLSDDYFWMRDKKNPEVISYLEAENAYTAAMMKQTTGLQERLYKEMLARIKETDTNVPYALGGYLYYTRTEQGKQYPVYARRKGQMTAPEQVLLDLNEMVKGQTFMAVGEFDVTQDTNLLAYSTDSNGYREYTLYVKDLRTGESTKVADRVSSAAWAADDKTLFYVVDHPLNKNPYRLYRHTLGQAAGADELVYEEKDEMFGIGVERSRSRGYIFLTSASHTTSEVRYLPADKPNEAFRNAATQRRA
ncbi:MAG: oligopeptidase [Acidobacteriota bacterium]|jgi:oligopeptidase B|nr:oligopeptidase [Acidobacteriota bacterium]